MTLDQLSISARDVIALLTFVAVGAGAYWRVMGKLKHLENGHDDLITRNRNADAEIAQLKVTTQQQAVAAAIQSTKLDAMKEVLDRIDKKLDSRQ